MIRRDLLMAFQPASFSLENLASWTGNAQPSSINHTAGMAEFTFRQTKAQLEASNAQSPMLRQKRWLPWLQSRPPLMLDAMLNICFGLLFSQPFLRSFL